MALKLKLLPGVFAVCRLAPEAAVPEWATAGPLTSITRTQEELSIVCLEAQVPAGVLGEKGWRCLKIEGPLPFSLTGVLASLVNPLSEAGISLFAFSTYDTDYVLVKKAVLDRAIQALTGAGHTVETKQA
jgi:hypothetical protein